MACSTLFNLPLNNPPEFTQKSRRDWEADQQETQPEIDPATVQLLLGEIQEEGGQDQHLGDLLPCQKPPDRDSELLMMDTVPRDPGDPFQELQMILLFQNLHSS